MSNNALPAANTQNPEVSNEEMARSPDSLQTEGVHVSGMQPLLRQEILSQYERATTNINRLVQNAFQAVLGNVDQSAIQLNNKINIYANELLYALGQELQATRRDFDSRLATADNYHHQALVKTFSDTNAKFALINSLLEGHGRRFEYFNDRIKDIHTAIENARILAIGEAAAKLESSKTALSGKIDLATASSDARFTKVESRLSCMKIDIDKLNSQAEENTTFASEVNARFTSLSQGDQDTKRRQQELDELFRQSSQTTELLQQRYEESTKGLGERVSALEMSIQNSNDTNVLLLKRVSDLGVKIPSENIARPQEIPAKREVPNQDENEPMETSRIQTDDTSYTYPLDKYTIGVHDPFSRIKNAKAFWAEPLAFDDIVNHEGLRAKNMSSALPSWLPKISHSKDVDLWSKMSQI